MTAQLGSLCTGYGGLDLAVGSLLDVEHAWHAEVDPAASKVLAAHWTGVPNLGDITSPPGRPYGEPRRRLTAPRRARQAAKRHARRIAGWRQWADAVDVLTGGIPCQPFSTAGKRRGRRDRRHLWPTGMLPAIEAFRPALVVLENVPGLLTIEKGQVFAQILADLDALGYTVSWTTVGACRVGACHHRHRFFLAATLAEVDPPKGEPVAHRAGDGWEPLQDVLFGDAEAVRWPSSGMARAGVVWPLPVQTCGADGRVVLPTPTARIADGRGTPSAETAAARMEAGRRNLEDAVALLPTPTVADSRGSRNATAGRADVAASFGAGWTLSDVVHAGRIGEASLLPTPRARDGETRGVGTGHYLADRRANGRLSLPEACALLPTPTTSDARGAGVHGDGGLDLRTAVAQLAASDARGVGPLLPTPRASDATKGGPNQRGSSGDLMLPAAVQPGRFGAYEAAVRRQEAAFGLPAPDPTEPGRLGKPRLAPQFPEWMVGLPKGWITDHVDRPAAIRIAGNGVVPAQAAHALSTLPTFQAASAVLSRVAVAA